MGRCDNCGYYWEEEWEKYPGCHYGDQPWPAPCEYDDYDCNEDDEDKLY